jgi:hypothetical protein
MIREGLFAHLLSALAKRRILSASAPASRLMIQGRATAPTPLATTSMSFRIAFESTLISIGMLLSLWLGGEMQL